ncbi:alpha/beta fold hydrolase [Caldimonas sp.]|jgi:triacylglycerol lipase|uniref:alpha/beta fold hydrolase n=1 Tax=Caldimonas sp. TaxID=2838790 RepID=UPI00307E304D
MVRHSRLARMQQGLTWGLVSVVLGWAVVAGALGRPAWMPLGAVIVVAGYGVLMALEFVLVACLHGPDPAPRATAVQLLRAWWGEVRTAPLVFGWYQPFRWHVVPDRLEGASGRRGVVLVHGFVCNRGLWTAWLRELSRQGHAFVAVNLEPVFGSIDEYVELIEAAVARLESATGLPPVLVCHSMGGLAVRAWLARRKALWRVHRVITIGTPHHGTWLGRWGLSTNARQMRLDSAWLKALAQQETPATYQRFTCFYGHADNIVFPASTATLEGADNRHLQAMAHVHMVFHPAVWQETMRWLSVEHEDDDASPPALQG